jgi:excisionase family DNA binding protein
MERLLSFKSACTRLGIKKRTLYRLIRERKLELRQYGQRGWSRVTLRSVKQIERVSDHRLPFGVDERGTPVNFPGWPAPGGWLPHSASILRPQISPVTREMLRVP